MPQAHAAYAQYAKATKTAKHAAVLLCLCVFVCAAVFVLEVQSMCSWRN